MLRTVVKQLLRRRPAVETLLEEWGRRAPWDSGTLRGRMREKAEGMRAHGYLEHPAIVHLETIAVCNAACAFCPYPGLERKGTRMPDRLIEKVIDELAGAPQRPLFQFAPYKVSEPFVEPRLFDILQRVNERLPHARIMLISNGAMLSDDKLARLRRVANVSFLSISLNYDDEHEYETVMGIPFRRTLERVDALHAALAAGELGFPVGVVRVSKDRDSDQRFVAWVRRRYPRFRVGVNPRNDWLGEVPGGGAYPDVPDVPCHRWFDLSVTATGKVAMCCMDGEARYPKGDVNTEHVLEIYNRPHLLELRRTLISRRAAPAPCSGCTYLSG